jgi:hypothetical protein
MERPKIVTDEHLEFLDALRDSGETNMFGATSYLEVEFRLTQPQAKEIHIYWMKSYGKEDR